MSQPSSAQRVCLGYACLYSQEVELGARLLESQTRQVQDIYRRRYAGQGYAWGGVYQDREVSSRLSLAERPSGLKLLGSLRPGCLLVAARGDRLFLHLREVCQLVTDWGALGIKLHLLHTGLLLETREQAEHFARATGLLLEMLGSRYLIHRDRMYRDSRFLGHKLPRREIPLGFRRLLGGQLAPCNQDRLTMGKILQWLNAGSNVQQIRQLLRDRKCQRAACNRPWSLREIQAAAPAEVRLREIQRQLLSGEILPCLLPPHYRNMDRLPACRDLFPLPSPQ